MKINVPTTPPINPIEVNTVSTTAADNVAEQIPEAQPLSQLTGQQVELFLDAEVKTLLAELAKLLTEQNVGLEQLPEQVGTQAKELLQQPFTASTALAGGFTKILKDQKAAVDTLASMASSFNDAAVFKQEFPEGLTETGQKLLTAFKQQTKLGNFSGKHTLAVARQLTSQADPAELAPLLRQVASQILAKSDSNLETGQKLPQVLEKFVAETAESLSRFGQLPGKEILIHEVEQVVRQVLQETGNDPAEAGSKVAAKQNPEQPLPLQADLVAENIVHGSKKENATGLTIINAKPVADEQPEATKSLQTVVEKIIDRFEQLVSKNSALQKNDIVENFRQFAEALEKSPQAKTLLETLTNMVKDKDILPANIRQAARMHNLPELEKAWTLAKLDSVREWLNMPKEVLNQTGNELRQLAVAVHRFAEKNVQVQADAQHNGMTLLVPLFLSPEAKPYPTYIHIFKDGSQEAAVEGALPEVWVRLCMATENIGLVDIVLHVFGDYQLHVRVKFSDQNAAEKFEGFIPDIRENVGGSKFTLTDISVAAVPEGHYPLF
ncbi:MAG: hypothetical protein H6Q74_2127 [Firmicutes bacterium]|nr:hypothetical protein [Bacillota bacterium]